MTNELPPILKGDWNYEGQKTMNDLSSLDQAVNDFEASSHAADEAADAVTQAEIAHAQAEANVTTAKGNMDAARQDRNDKFQALKDAVASFDPNAAAPPAADGQ